VGDNGFICTTFDGGFAWQEEKLQSNMDVQLNDVFVLDDLSAVAVGGDWWKILKSSLSIQPTMCMDNAWRIPYSGTKY
jgi:hypothetical protein